MSPVPPPQVRAAEGKPHHVFDWKLPIRIGGAPVVLVGSLDYEPPPKSRFNPLLIVPLAALAVVGAAVWWTRRLRRSTRRHQNRRDIPQRQFCVEPSMAACRLVRVAGVGVRQRSAFEPEREQRR
jgi:hypothetical protein